LHAWGNIALIAQTPEEVVGSIREVPLLYPFHP